MAYFQTKRGSLEESIRKAVINEASVRTDLDDDPKLFKQIERMGVKVKKHGKPQDGYQEVTLSGPQAKIDAANKKLNLLPEDGHLDKVNPAAVKKKFKDRKDKDIDNDGDVDSTDKYLHKRRKAISKAMGKEKVDEAIGDLQKKGSDDSMAGAQTRSYQRQFGPGNVGNPHRQMQFAKAAFKDPDGPKSQSGIISYV